MKILVKLFLLFISSLLITACATTGKIQVPEKYALGNKLEQVNKIYRTRIMNWEEVDKQSLFIETAPSEYYLIVLMIPSPELIFRNRISITHTGSMIRAGLDSVMVFNGTHVRGSYPIDRIYRVKGAEQMRTVRDQLTSGKGAGAGRTVKHNIENSEGAEI